MKTRIAAALASLIVASMGTAAYAQTTPQQPMPQSASTMASPQSNQMSSQGSGMQSSSNVEEKVKHELTSHGVTATDVQVSFSNGTATLTGTVATHKDIKKAKKAAMRVRGVKHVDVSGLQAGPLSSAPASS
ncbi:MAG TPA: BON domain-containing protein [Rhodanobacteraceae bacterium]|jgi:osmotically-inducible protein OsmY|nr:BON domain-containing protein [Rhodanobacteraceae bacterium]